MLERTGSFHFHNSLLYYEEQKVNCQGKKQKVNFTLEQATKAQRGSRGIALLFLNLSTRWAGWSVPRPGHFTPGKDLIPIV
jgi:hypothetical protein